MSAASDHARGGGGSADTGVGESAGARESVVFTGERWDILEGLTIGVKIFVKVSF